MFHARGSRSRDGSEVALFKVQVEAPTLAVLLVNLDQEDRLVLQALEVRALLSRHVRPGRL